MFNCKVCRSLAVKKIEIELLTPGISYSSISKKYLISYRTLKTHKEKHLVKEVAKDMEARIPELVVPKIDPEVDIPQLDNLSGCVSYVHNKILNIYKGAMEEGNKSLALQALKQDLECVSLIIKGKELRLSYQSQNSWEASLQKILKAVENNPEARIAISDALYNEEEEQARKVYDNSVKL